MAILATLSLIVTVVFPWDARASGDWYDTFEPSAVASYLDVEDAAVMVIGAGGPEGDLVGAVTAVEEAFRGSGATRLVMDAKAIGRIDDLGDGQIIERTAAFPIDRAVLVRVFAGDDEEDATAVVTFYDKSGDAVAAFTASRGVTLARQGGGKTPSSSSGVSKDAMDAVSDAMGDTTEVAEDLEEAIEEYEKRCLWYQEWVGISSSSGAVVARWSELYQGKYKKEVSGEDFYEIIGRSDLLADYRDRQKKRGLFNLLGWGAGTPILITGIMVTARGAGAPDPFQPNFYDLGEAPINQGTIAGGVILMAIGGSVMGIFAGKGFSIAPHPVDETEARELVDEYNKQLKEELGIPKELSDRAPALPSPSRSHSDLELAISVGPGSLVLHGRF